MNEDKSMNKRQWTYEDAVDYVLKNMKRKVRKQFEEDLKWDEELRELYELALSRKEMFKKLEKHEISKWKIKSGYEKVLNILRDDIKPEPAQIWQLNFDLLSGIEKKFFEDLYVLILDKVISNEFKKISEVDFETDEKRSFELEPERSEEFHLVLHSKPLESDYCQQSRTSKNGINTSYRILLLSKKPEYALNHDLIFSEPLISTVKNNVVAHIHITGNLLDKHLSFYIGNIDNEIFKVIRKADFGDYSLVDNKKIFRKELEEDSEFEKIEIWTDVVRKVLNRFSDETLDTIEESVTGQLIEDYHKERKGVLFSLMADYNEIDIIPKPTGKIKFGDKKKYLIDENDYIIIKKNKSQLPENVRELISESTQILEIKNPHFVSMEEIYEKNYLEKAQLEKRLIYLTKQGYNLLEIDSTTSRETRYTARTNREHLSQNYIELYSDDNFIVSFCILERESKPELFIEIVFLSEKNLNKIDLFLFNVEDSFEGYFSKNIRVIGGVALIPLYLLPEKIIKNYNKYFIGFKYRTTEIELKLKLIIQ